MKKIFHRFIFLCLLAGSFLPVYADGTHPRGITLDGTIGTAGMLDIPGPNYEIKAEHGHQAGANLFHSFQKFNIHSNESATFSGPNSVQNIISRVTGGNASWIDGTLRSTIPGADMYLLNPAGMMFGANARLDLGGSFHVSTADYLRLGENDRFYAMPQGNDVLSIAAPTAFGFLDGDAGMVSVEGKGKLTTEVWGEADQSWDDWWKDNNLADENTNLNFYPGLAVPEKETISMVGGNIEIKGTYVPYEDMFGIHNKPVGANLNAPEGRVNLVSVKSAGEVRLTGTGLNVSAEEPGNITMSDGAGITVNSRGDNETRGGAGSVFISGNTFTLDNYSRIVSQPMHEDGQVIDIQADKVFLQNESEIEANTFGTGNGTEINITASDEVRINDGKIKNGSFYESGDNAGDAGTLSIKTQKISMTGDMSLLGGQSYGTGKGGNIVIYASESADVSNGAKISTLATEWSTGQAGNISINAPSLSIETEAEIKSGSSGAGKGGNIEIHTKNLQIIDEGKISVRSEQTGDGGNLTISGSDPANDKDFADSITLAGSDSAIRADTIGSGNAGTISITAKELSLTDDASIATSASHTGNAGNITLEVQKLNLSKGTFIASAGEHPASNVYSAADIMALNSLTETAQEGDVVIVQDAGDGTSARFIKPIEPAFNISTGELLFWIPIGDKVTAVAERSTLDDIFFAMQIQTGETVIVEDMGDGSPGSFVYAGLMQWIEINKTYLVSDFAQRNQFISLPGDMAQIDTGGGTTENFVYTGEEWISIGDVHTVADIASRNQLAKQTGDVAKVADAGEGKAKSFIFDGNQWIKCYMTGNAGTITVNAQDAVFLQDDASLTTASTGGVQPGRITLDADRVQLSGNALISSTSKAIGDAGQISATAYKTVTLQDNAAVTTTSFGQGSAGDITLETENLEMKENASVSSASKFPGKGGDAGTISVHAADAVQMTGNTSVSTSSQGKGDAGDITITAARVSLDNGASISSASNADQSGGAAGTIFVSAGDSIRLKNKSSLTTQAENTGAISETEDQLNGRITVQTGNLLYLSDSEITSSVKGGLGNGGNIDIGEPEFVTMNKSKIKANAYQGKGGNIHIISGQFVQSSDSTVSASSKLGIDGSVEIEAPDEDVSGGLTILPSTFLDATRWMKTPCAARSGENTSRFVIMGRDATPTAPDDLIPSPPSLWFGGGDGL